MKSQHNWSKQEVKYYIQSQTHKLMNSTWGKEELPDQQESITVQIYKGTRLSVVIIEEHHYYQLHAKFYPISFSQVNM
jgi:hypothetical protein